MSEVKVKRTPAKKEDPGFFGKVLNFFKNLPKNIAKPFRNTWRELRKVTWPTRETLINSTLLVLAFMAFMGIVIGLLDWGSTRIVTLAGSL